MAQEERSDRSAGSNEYSLSGYQVYDRHYEKIGKVDDLFVDESDRPEYVGVKMGFLGTRSTLIPVEIVRVNDKRRLVEVEADKDTVKEGPTFGDDREITPDFERRVLSYYGVETARASTQRRAYGPYYPDTIGGSEHQVDLLPGERAGTGSVDRKRDDDPRDEGEFRVQRREEEFRAGVREREAGGMKVRKRVRTDREQLTRPKKRREVRMESIPVEEGTATSETEIGEDETRVPVIEEEIVVEKRPVVKEEIHLRKKVVEDEEVVEEDVRKEEVDIEDRTERGGTGERAEEVDEVRRSLPEETRHKTSSEDRGRSSDRERESSKKEARLDPPFKGYDDLSVKEAKKKIDGLSKGELEKVRSYEKEHKNRKTLIEELDRKLGK